MRRAIIIPLLLTAAPLTHPLHADVIYVDLHANGKRDGSSWKNAYTDLQDALARTESGDQIWVAEGTYYPTESGDRAISFELVDGVGLFGGFAGNETRLRDRQHRKNTTILSGNIGGRGRETDNSFHILTGENLGTETVVDGFTITAAFNDQDGVAGRGGGAYLLRSSLTISHCKFVSNHAGGGAGIWNQNSNPSIAKCVFRENSRIGLYNDASSPRVLNCLFVKNSSAHGGAMYGRNGSNPTVVGSTFVRNRVTSSGGAYYGWGNPTFVNCVFRHNKAGIFSGGLELRAGTAVITNCIIYGNHAGQDGGGGGTFSENSTPVINNSIFWGNTGKPDRVEENQFFLHAGTINYSYMQGWSGQFGGVGNPGKAPLFVDADGRNLRLMDGSPCVNKGDDDAVGEPLDLDGNPRSLGRAVDMGAYENTCRAVRRMRARCRAGGVVKAKARTRLPEGSTVRFTIDAGGSGDIRAAKVDDAGQAIAKFKNQTGLVTVCIEGCPDTCQTTDCP